MNTLITLTLTLTLSPDIPALSSPAAHRLTTRESDTFANAGVAVSVRHDATHQHIAEVVTLLREMAEGRA